MIPATFQFDPYLPLFDPDTFSDVAFYRELEAIGYRQVLLGGTGSAHLLDVIRAIKDETSLQVALYPAGPDSVCKADVVLMPDVMNSNSHFARPFGSGSVATAMNIMQQGLPFLPVAYIIMGNSTARWYFDAFLLPSSKVLIGYAMYARMVGYRYLALDYEDPEINIDAALIRKLRQIPDLHLVVSDEFTPESAAEALSVGAQTVITPSDVFEEASDPLAVARAFYDSLLRPS
ncbi:MAG: geranylgeranylglyceryl/heptaprenylglyceryl phosphate synthase [Nannocystaceae bacterium]